MRGFILAIVLFLGIPTVLSADSYTLQAKLQESIAQQSFLNPGEQSFCAKGSGLDISYNPAQPVIPASVSKLFLTDWALHALGKDYVFKTEFKYYKNTLYITGGYDPNFLPEDLSDGLKNLQIQNPKLKIKRIIFSRNFYFNWSTGTITTHLNLQRFAREHPEFFDIKVRVAQANIPQLKSTKSYTHKSDPLLIVIKQMNVYSTNSTADILFAKLGGKPAFQRFVENSYKDEQVNFGVGSGLDRNYTTCGATIKMLERLYKYSLDTGMPLSSFVAVPGSDPGNLSKRFPSSPYTNSFVAKDGYIWGVNSLAGITTTQNGPVYFAIFLGYSKAWHYKAGAQTVEQMTNTLLGNLPLAKFNYQPN